MVSEGLAITIKKDIQEADRGYKNWVVRSWAGTLGVSAKTIYRIAKVKEGRTEKLSWFAKLLRRVQDGR